MEHIDHDYLSTLLIQIPSKSKTSFSSSFIFYKSPELSIPALCLLCKMSYREVARERTQSLMTHLQISAISCPFLFGRYGFGGHIINYINFSDSITYMYIW